MTLYATRDSKDAFTIANIVREGKYIDTIIEDGIFRELRTLAHARERIVRQSIRSKHVLQTVLDDYFPELRQLFWSMNAKSLWALLDAYPFPEDVRTAGLPAVTALHTSRKLRIGEHHSHHGSSGIFEPLEPRGAGCYHLSQPAPRPITKESDMEQQRKINPGYRRSSRNPASAASGPGTTVSRSGRAMALSRSLSFMQECLKSCSAR